MVEWPLIEQLKGMSSRRLEGLTGVPYRPPELPRGLARGRLAKAMRAARKPGGDLGLAEEELAFYDATRDQ
jgi:hypothetical protein